MSYTQYWAIFNRWYIAYTLLYIRHSPCTCRIRGIGPYSTMVIHTLCTFIHQTYTLYMSYTRYWAIFNRWYIACTLLYIRHTPCTCRIRGIGPYSTRWYIAYTLLYIRHSPCTCRIHGIGPYSTGDTYPVHFYTSDIHPVHVVYAVLGHIQPVIHSLYTFKHQTYTLYMSYMRYWAIFNRWYMTLYTFIHQTYTLYMSSPYAVLGHIQMVIHDLYTFIHQTYTLYMS